MNMIPYLADFFYNQFTGWEMKMFHCFRIINTNIQQRPGKEH